MLQWAKITFQSKGALFGQQRGTFMICKNLGGARAPSATPVPPPLSGADANEEENVL